jgi:hypothetical protein
MTRCRQLAIQERLNATLLRDMKSRLRRRVRRARDPLAIINTMAELTPLILTLTDRALDLRLRQLELALALGLPESAPLPWSPTDLEDVPPPFGLSDEVLDAQLAVMERELGLDGDGSLEQRADRIEHALA